MIKFAWFACIVMSIPLVSADPCGMVPPIMLTSGTPELTRVGDQLTYVFFKDGIEDIALRPGFKGKLTDFGMLIPFPVVPDIRKVSDNIFTHLKHAIDPPVIVVDLRPKLKMAKRLSSQAGGVDADELFLGRVTVLKEEAVGMYQVVVLAAADPQALAAWMRAHHYVYPAGMDGVCAEYIEADWCFVAVKANVGSQQAVEPRPGMRKADALVDDATGFEGAVQAMGFRFKTDKPVVPMRLSAFNAGDLHNIVYLFSEQSMQIKELPAKFVQGKISGRQLLRNMTEPLPVKVLGGTLEQAEKMGLFKQPRYNRDPRPKNGDAYDLLSADLLAVKTGELTHPFEAREKELLKIGERLGLRGENVDKLIGEVISRERLAAAEAVKEAFDGMVLTVIEGDFPREVIAKHNLHFKPFAARELKLGMNEHGQAVEKTVVLGSALILLLGLLMIRRRTGAVYALGLFLLTGIGVEDSEAAASKSVQVLMTALSDPETSEAAADTIIALGDKALPDLIGEAVEGNDYNRRGWAIACLADIGSKEAVQSLTRIMDDSDTPDLVKMWSGAALTRIRGVDAIKDLMLAAAKDPSRKQALAGLLLGMRAGAVRPLTTIMLTGETNQERQQATAWLGTLDQRLRGGIVRKVLNDALAYSAGQAKEGAPWAGGALYLPRSAWTTREAWDMTRHLLCWLVWSEEHGKKDIATQLQNNLRDLSWRNGVGFRQGGSGRDWARALLKKRSLDTSAINDQTPYQAVILIVQLLSFSA
ncbi:MAG: DUF2330 domain-containing protein [Verrucomicrobiota bacterium]